MCFLKTIESKDKLNPRLLEFIVPASLAFIVFLLYGSSLSYQFLFYDDMELVVENPNIRFLSLSNLYAIFSQQILPVRDLSYAIDLHLWGLSARAFHGVSVALMALNSILLYFLLRRFFPSVLVPFSATLLFAIHPINTEVVCWISARKDLLAFFFFTASFLSFLKISDLSKPLLRDRLWFMGSLALALTAYLAKPSTFPLPAVIGLYLWTFKPSLSIGRKLFITSMYALLLLPVLIRFIFLADATELIAKSSTAYANWAIAWQVPLAYLMHFFYPLNLTVSYIIPFDAPTASPAFYLAVAFNVIFVGVTILLILRRSKIGFCLGTLLLLFLPIANFLPTKVPISDRYFYIIFPELAVLVAVGIKSLCFFLSSRMGRAQNAYAFFITSLVVIALSLIPITLTQKNIWQNSKSIISELVRLEPTNPLFLNSLGLEYFKEGKYAQAEQLYRSAIYVAPRYHKAYFNLAGLAFKKGNINQANYYVDQALAIDPNYEQGKMLRKFLESREKR
jgi:hypothetical protein